MFRWWSSLSFTWHRKMACAWFGGIRLFLWCNETARTFCGSRISAVLWEMLLMCGGQLKSIPSTFKFYSVIIKPFTGLLMTSKIGLNWTSLMLMSGKVGPKVKCLEKEACWGNWTYSQIRSWISFQKLGFGVTPSSSFCVYLLLPHTMILRSELSRRVGNSMQEG